MSSKFQYGCLRELCIMLFDGLEDIRKIKFLVFILPLSQWLLIESNSAAMINSAACLLVSVILNESTDLKAGS